MKETNILYIYAIMCSVQIREMEQRRQKVDTQILYIPSVLALRSFSGINNVFCSNYSGNGTKSGNYIFDDDIQPYIPPQQKARNVEEPNPAIEPEQEPESESPVEPRAPVTTTTAQSDCPVEGGAVYTKWGAVSLGTVLAGIAAGLFPQNVPIAELVRRAPPAINLPPDLTGSTIDNRFAATLVGKDSLQFVD